MASKRSHNRRKTEEAVGRIDLHRTTLARTALYGSVLDEVYSLTKEIVGDTKISPKPTDEEVARHLQSVREKLSRFNDTEVRRLAKDLRETLEPGVNFMKTLFSDEQYSELHGKFDRIVSLLREVHEGKGDPDTLRDKLAAALIALKIHTPYYRSLAYTHYFDTITDLAGKYEIRDHPLVRDKKAKYGSILAVMGAHEHLYDPYVVSYLLHHALEREGVNLSEKNPIKFHLAMDAAVRRFADYLRMYSDHPAVGKILSTRVGYFYRLPPEELVSRFGNHVGSKTLKGLNRDALLLGWHSEIERDLDMDPSLIRTLPVYSQLVASGVDPVKAWRVVRFIHRSSSTGVGVLRNVSPRKIEHFYEILKMGHEDVAHALLASGSPFSRLDHVVKLLRVGISKDSVKDLLLSGDSETLTLLSKHADVLPKDVLEFFAKNRHLSHHLPYLADALRKGRLRNVRSILGMLDLLPKDRDVVKRFWQHVELAEDLGHDYPTVVRWGDVNNIRREIELLKSANYNVSEALRYRGKEHIWNSLLALAKSGITLPEGSYDNAHHVFALLTGKSPVMYAKELKEIRSRDIVAPGDLARLNELENLKIPRPQNVESLVELIDEVSGIAADLARKYHRRIPGTIRADFRDAISQWIDNSLGLFLHFALKNKGIDPREARVEHAGILHPDIEHVLRTSAELLKTTVPSKPKKGSVVTETPRRKQSKKPGPHPKLATSL